METDVIRAIEYFDLVDAFERLSYFSEADLPETPPAIPWSSRSCRPHPGGPPAGGGKRWRQSMAETCNRA